VSARRACWLPQPETGNQSAYITSLLLISFAQLCKLVASRLCYKAVAPLTFLPCRRFAATVAATLTAAAITIAVAVAVAVTGD
jgi:hypothetical protein